MDDKIVLDRKSFEALAVDTRVRILKSLKERRKTLSEIAEEQDMSVSGIKEHLAVLEKVGLIEKIDDGHKWKYYELTKKGKEIVGPKELRVWILLSMSTFALVASMLMMFSTPMMTFQSAGPMEDTAMPITEVPPVGKEAMVYSPMEAADDGAPDETATTPLRNETEEADPDLSVPIAVAAISALVMVGCLGILLRNRWRFTSP